MDWFHEIPFPRHAAHVHRQPYDRWATYGEVTSWPTASIVMFWWLIMHGCNKEDHEQCHKEHHPWFAEEELWSKQLPGSCQKLGYPQEKSLVDVFCNRMLQFIIIQTHILLYLNVELFKSRAAKSWINHIRGFSCSIQKNRRGLPYCEHHRGWAIFFFYSAETFLFVCRDNALSLFAPNNHYCCPYCWFSVEKVPAVACTF